MKCYFLENACKARDHPSVGSLHHLLGSSKYQPARWNARCRGHPLRRKLEIAFVCPIPCCKMLVWHK